MLFFFETIQTRTFFYLIVFWNLKLAPLSAKHVQHTIGKKKKNKQKTKGSILLICVCISNIDYHSPFEIKHTCEIRSTANTILLYFGSDLSVTLYILEL